jgi:hypothetical protein
VHNAKLRINKIKVEVETFPLTHSQVNMFGACIPPDSETLAGLHARQNANEPFTDPVSLHNGPSCVFLRLFRRVQIEERPSVLLRQFLSVSFNPIGYLLSKFIEVFVKHSQARQKSVHSTQMTNRGQVSPEQNPIKPCYNAGDAAFMPLHKSLHGFPPVWIAFQQPIMPEEAMERYHFLVAAEPRCVSATLRLMTFGVRKTAKTRREVAQRIEDTTDERACRLGTSPFDGSKVSCFGLRAAKNWVGSRW